MTSTTQEIALRRRDWTMGTGAREVVGSACRCGLERGKSCRTGECMNPPFGVATWTTAVEHGKLWVRNGERFILAHVYGTKEMIAEWAASYSEWAGLDWKFGAPEDGWYGHGTVPVVYQLKEEN